MPFKEAVLLTLSLTDGQFVIYVKISSRKCETVIVVLNFLGGKDMRRTVGAIVGILFGFVAVSALAETSMFNNNLNSWIMVSPAQLYQVQGNKVDPNFEHGTGKATNEIGTTKSETEITGNVISATGVYSIGTDLKAGIGAGMDTMTQKDKEADTKEDGKTIHLTPQAAYQIQNMAAVGLEADMRMDSIDRGNDRKFDSTYFVIRPGALYTMKNLEAGLVYQTQVEQKVKKTINGAEDEYTFEHPAEVVLHGRYALDQNLALGAQLHNIMHSAFKDTVTNLTTSTTEKIATKNDQQVVRFTGEYSMDALKTEGGFEYATAYHKKKEYMTSETISTMGLRAAADYSISKEAAVGGGLAYDFGSDKQGDNKYATNDMTIQVRGKVAF